MRHWVILAGGKGERFWPLSRRDRPKQFLDLEGQGRTLLQQTADRLTQTGEEVAIWVVTTAPVADLVREQLPDLPTDRLLIEPEPRDTAAAIAWTTWQIAQRHGEEAIIGFFPADHWIAPGPTFGETLEQAVVLVQSQPAIVTLGIEPTHPATGYGYIQQGHPVDVDQLQGVYRVQRFTEKPDRPTAEGFLNQGGFYWNSGMFLFQAGIALGELDRHCPHVIQPIRDKGTTAYGDLAKLSIDYALMEKTELAYVIPAAFGWDDLGDWLALGRLLPPQSDGNVAIGHHLGLDTQRAIVYNGDPDELVVTLGLEDLVVVREGKVTLIAHRHHTQNIKAIVKALQNHERWGDLL